MAGPAKGLTRVCVTLVALVTLGGCGLIGDDLSDKPTITQQQAVQRVDELVSAAVSGVKPQPRLVAEEGFTLARRCSDPTDGGSTDRIIVSKRFWLQDVPVAKHAGVARQIRANLVKQGHTVETTRGIEKNQPEIFARSRPDDFLMSITSSGGGPLSIGASSPCIWQNGTPGQTPTLY